MKPPQATARPSRRWSALADRSPVLGVLGGMGPAATAAFLHELAAHFPATSDQEHPRVLVLSDPAIPDRSSAIVRGSDAPLAPIRNGLHTLISWGADVLAVPCNTAHYFIDTIAEELRAPLVSIVHATIDDAIGENATGAWLLATTGTVMSGVYQRAAAQRGFSLRVPPPSSQEAVQAAIAAIKAGDIQRGAAWYADVAARLLAEQDVPLIDACTELPLASEAARFSGGTTISSITSLARATIRALTTGDPRD